VREAWFSANKGNSINKPSEISADILTPAVPEEEGGSAVPLPKIAKQPEQVESISASSAVSGIEFFTDEPVKADFNFSNAGLAAVVSYFAQQLNFSYIVEGTISGSATLAMHEELTKKELWTIFCNLLRISNMTAAYDGKVLRLRSNS